MVCFHAIVPSMPSRPRRLAWHTAALVTAQDVGTQGNQQNSFNDFMNLLSPVTTQYNYPALSHFISVWWSIESQASWSGKGYAPCAPVHRSSVSSRQYDSSSSVLDDELEKNTAEIVGACMDKLDAVERCIVMYGECQMDSSWVRDMDADRAQTRYEAALLKLALLCRRDGVDV